MHKHQAVNLINRKVPKEALFNEFYKEQSIFVKKISKEKLILRAISVFALLAPVPAFILSGSIFIGVLLSFCVICFFLDIMIAANDYDEKPSPSKEYYKDDKYREEFQKHIDLNNKLNEKVDQQLSLGTYELLAKYLSENDLKKIARFKLTYFDLGLRDYYIFYGEEVIKVRDNIEKIALANRLRDTKLMLEEKLKQKEKEERKNYIADTFISSLYKK